MSMASRAIFSNFFEEQWTQNHPQYLSGLSRALFPKTFLETAVYLKSSDWCTLGSEEETMWHLELFSARLPVKVFKTLNGRHFYILSKFHKIVDKIMLKCISAPEAADRKVKITEGMSLV